MLLRNSCASPERPRLSASAAADLLTCGLCNVGAGPPGCSWQPRKECPVFELGPGFRQFFAPKGVWNGSAVSTRWGDEEKHPWADDPPPAPMQRRLVTGPRWPSLHPTKHLTGREGGRGLFISGGRGRKPELGLLQWRTKVKGFPRSPEPSLQQRTVEWSVQGPCGPETWHSPLLQAYLEQDDKVGQTQVCCPLTSNRRPGAAHCPVQLFPSELPIILGSEHQLSTGGCAKHQAAGRAFSAPGGPL